MAFDYGFNCSDPTTVAALQDLATQAGFAGDPNAWLVNWVKNQIAAKLAADGLAQGQAAGAVLSGNVTTGD